MKKNESGRSMVEMLGVLAIIGVLSVGGIAGYTMAMNRYRANEVVDMANKYAVIAYSAFMTNKMMNNGTEDKSVVPTFASTGLFGSNSKVNNTKIEIKTPESDVSESGIKITLTFAADGKKICQATATSLGVSSAETTEGSKSDCGADTPTIVYFYKQS